MEKKTLKPSLFQGYRRARSSNLDTDGGNGVWLIGGNDLDNLAELTLTPASDWTGKIGLTILATSTDGGTSTAGFGILVAGVPDAPVLSVASAAGLEDATISLVMSATVRGAETLHPFPSLVFLTAPRCPWAPIKVAVSGSSRMMAWTALTNSRSRRQPIGPGRFPCR